MTVGFKLPSLHTAFLVISWGWEENQNCFWDLPSFIYDRKSKVYVSNHVWKGLIWPISNVCFTFKVEVFWEGHKMLKLPSHNIWTYYQKLRTFNTWKLYSYGKWPITYLELKSWKRLEYCLSIEQLYDGMTELGVGFRGLFWFYRNS